MTRLLFESGSFLDVAMPCEDLLSLINDQPQGYVTLPLGESHDAHIRLSSVEAFFDVSAVYKAQEEQAAMGESFAVEGQEQEAA